MNSRGGSRVRSCRRGREADRVGEQIIEDLRHPGAVGDELVDARLDRDVEGHVVLFEPLAHPWAAGSITSRTLTGERFSSSVPASMVARSRISSMMAQSVLPEAECRSHIRAACRREARRGSPAARLSR